MTACVICLAGMQQYAIPVANILEVAAMVRLTPLPDAPFQVLGVVNRRGAVIPLLDLRLCLGHPATPPDLNTVFVVVQAAEYAAGLVVDDIKEVAALPAVSAPPARSGPYIRGMAILNELPVLVLDVAALLRAFAPTDLAVESDA
jgi:purine-binding chemotaxis protein CheW